MWASCNTQKRNARIKIRMYKSAALQLLSLRNTQKRNASTGTARAAVPGSTARGQYSKEKCKTRYPNLCPVVAQRLHYAILKREMQVLWGFGFCGAPDELGCNTQKRNASRGSPAAQCSGQSQRQYSKEKCKT